MKTLESSKSSNGTELNEVNCDNGSASCPQVGSDNNLIICDSQLASSFREVNCSKGRVKPGHYLQKVLLGKLKSQSVPSLDKDFSKEADVDGSPCSDPVDDTGEENKDDWYKTWPDCVDKEKLKNGLKEDPPNPNVLNLYTPRALNDVHLPLAYSPITKQLHLLNHDDLVSGRKGALVKLEPPSHDSTVSSLSDVCPSTQGDPCDFSSIGNCSLASEDDSNDRPKKKGLSGILSRGVFNWKIRDQESWSLFSRSGSSGSEDRRSLCSDQGIIGTSGLIQLERPAWLPAKPHEEHQAHLDQHDKMLTSNRKKELKEAKLREKLLQQQLKSEDEAAQATRIWTQEIFPKWPTTRNQKRTLELWWQGIPPCVRGKIWKLAIPNDLNLTHDLYFICLSRAMERLRSAAGSSNSINQGHSESGSDQVHTMELIQLDISRTFPHLCIFQKKGPYYEMLHSVLAAYVCYRPDVGYVQGMSFIAAVLILNMDAADAFVCFSNLLNKPLHRAFFSLDQSVMNAYYATYCILLKENLPNLFKHLQECRLTPDLYLLDWLYTVFAKATHLDLASRLWDIFLRDGEEFLFRAAIGFESCVSLQRQKNSLVENVSFNVAPIMFIKTEQNGSQAKIAEIVAQTQREVLQLRLNTSSYRIQDVHINKSFEELYNIILGNGEQHFPPFSIQPVDFCTKTYYLPKIQTWVWGVPCFGDLRLDFGKFDETYNWQLSQPSHESNLASAPIVNTSYPGILKMFEPELLTMDFLGGSKFLIRLQEDLSVTRLFKCIAQVKMSTGKTNFYQILQCNLSSL